MAPIYNINIEEGSFFRLDIKYTNEDETSAIDNDTPYCCVLSYATGDPPTVQRLGSDNISINNGIISINLTPEDTEKLQFDSALYELDLLISNVDSSISPSFVSRLLTGTITVERRLFDKPTSCIGSITNVSNEINLISISGQIENSIIDNVLSIPELLDFSSWLSDRVNELSSVSPSPTPTPNDNNSDMLDLCYESEQFCFNMDVASIAYVGSGINLSDNSISSSSINIENSGILSNLEIEIDGLSHTSVQDLTLVLEPPSGDPIVLCKNQKIKNSNIADNFTFVFSNKAADGQFLHNMTGILCNIYNKPNSFGSFGMPLLYNNNIISGSINHLIDKFQPSGIWTLYCIDSDILSSGSIAGWKTIVTYSSDEEIDEV
jgi:hypothetical protein